MRETSNTNAKVKEDGLVDGGTVSQASGDLNLIDGGEVKDVKEPGDFHERKHRAFTASKLGMTLVWMLGVSFLINFVGKIILEIYGLHEASKALSDDFKTWLPVIASLVAAAVAYYFSKEKEK